MFKTSAYIDDWNTGRTVVLTATVRTLNDETVTTLEFGHSYALTLDAGQLKALSALLETLAGTAVVQVIQEHDACLRAAAEAEARG